MRSFDLAPVADPLHGSVCQNDPVFGRDPEPAPSRELPEHDPAQAEEAALLAGSLA